MANKQTPDTQEPCCGEQDTGPSGRLASRTNSIADGGQSWIRWLVLIGLIATVSGCQLTQRFRRTDPLPPALEQKGAPPVDIRQRLNEQSQRVQQLKTDVRIATEGIPNLRGDLVVERPDNLRLTAGLMGMSDLGFDLGCNSQLFWVWKKVSGPNDPPALYYARHVDYLTSPIQEQLQLQPKWMLAALGLVEFTGDEAPPTRNSDGFWEIVLKGRCAEDAPYRVILVDPRYGWVVRQSFYDRQGNLTAYIDSQKYRYYPEQDVSLPHHMEIHLQGPGGQQSLVTLIAGDYTINALYGDPQRLWTMPNPPDVPKIDLASPQGNAPEFAATPHVSRDWSTFPTTR